MVNLYKKLFLSTLIMGTILAISAPSWIGMWMGLEINLLSIIPLMNSSKNQMASESSLKYFITQAIASAALLLSVIMLLSLKIKTTPMVTSSGITIMSSSLLMKMGAAPFHFWFPEIMEGLEWLNSLIMMTWQKIAPMVILMSITYQTSLIYLAMLTSMIVGGVLGLNQTSLRKILAFSSINHIGWMLSALTLSFSLWLIYFLVYAFITTNVVMISKTYNLYFVPQMYMQTPSMLKLTFVINFISMGGVPPFLGFLPKWLVLEAMSHSNNILSILMVILTIITLFYYVRLMIPAMALNSAETKIKNLISTKFIIWTSNFINLASLSLCTAWFNLI